MEEEIIDVSGKKLSRDDWRKIIEGPICRLNKEQFIAITPNDKSEIASSVFDFYSSIPVGTYYIGLCLPMTERSRA